MPRSANPLPVHWVWRVPLADRQFLRLVRLPDAPDAKGPERTPRLRRASLGAGIGTGTGRGGKEPAPLLIRKMKLGGPREAFVKYIGDREVSVVSLRNQFNMTNANVNAYLRNLWKDHGIGYSKEDGRLRLILPRKSTWFNVWKV